ncbi:MAG TPA: hypothetical protein VK929_10565 [Longimicrobiales bacterium]|nr:hypothetical protein [Longimicrobiales bacterium]
MPQRRLGTILLESGRIDDDDVQRALEYQRTHGGYFGQALVALGALSQDEIDWALASHFDVPFIFPDAEAVDPAVAHVVPADWALAHLAVPIVRAGRTLTVVVADMPGGDVIEELRALTGCEVEMALASAPRIRELIHAVYDAPHARRMEDATAMSPGEFFGLALDRGATRFGISARGGHAIGWWRVRGETHRVPLTDGWEHALDDALRPPLRELLPAGGDQVEWQATLGRARGEVSLSARALTGSGGYELMFRPTGRAAAAVAAEAALPPGIAAELRVLWRAGSARVGLLSDDPEAARAVLPLLPGLALGSRVRAAHMNETGTDGGSYTLQARATDEFVQAVASYELDAVTVDLPVDYPVQALLRTAPLSFTMLNGVAAAAAGTAGSGASEASAVAEAVAEAAARQGVNWLLTMTGQADGYAWDLRAVQR